MLRLTDCLAIPDEHKPEDVTPVPEDPSTLQTYMQDRRVIGVSRCRVLVGCAISIRTKIENAHPLYPLCRYGRCVL